jgi:hypothetical protein
MDNYNTAEVTFQQLKETTATTLKSNDSSQNTILSAMICAGQRKIECDVHTVHRFC